MLRLQLFNEKNIRYAKGPEQAEHLLDKLPFFHVDQDVGITDEQPRMCADPNQGFLKHRLSWRSVGLNVLGRTRKLQQPYR